MEIKNYAPGMIYLQDDQNVLSSDYSGAHPYIVIGRYEDNKDYVEALHMVQCMCITTLKNRKVRVEVPILFNGRVKYIIPFNLFSFKLEYFKSPQLIRGCIMNSVGDTTEFINFLMELYLATNNLMASQVDEKRIKDKYNKYVTWFFTEYKDYPNDAIIDLKEINSQISFRERYFNLSDCPIFSNSNSDSISSTPEVIPEVIPEATKSIEIIDTVAEEIEESDVSIKGKTKWEDAERQEGEILQMYTERMLTVTEISDILNINTFYISKIIKRNSLMRKSGESFTAKNKKKEISTMFKSGESTLTIAKKMNISLSTIENLLNKINEKENIEPDVKDTTIRVEELLVREDLSEDVSKMSCDKLEAFSLLYKKKGAKYICNFLKSDLCKVRNKMAKIEKEIVIRNRRGTYSPKLSLVL